MTYWSRPVLKQRAKLVLANTYWMTFLALILAGLLGADAGMGTAAPTFNYNIDVDYPGFSYNGNIVDFFSHELPLLWQRFLAGGIAWTVLVILVFTVLISIAIGIMVSNPITVGKCRFLALGRFGEKQIGELFFSFRDGRYNNAVKTMFLKKLYTFLWSLLFVIPGIVKSYSYFMVPYILAENPYISTERAFEISKQTTAGEKWEMFVMNLSFIGWSLLCLLTCGIGFMFLSPYYEASMAELYAALRFKAVNCAICSPDEIGRELFEQPKGGFEPKDEPGEES